MDGANLAGYRPPNPVSDHYLYADSEPFPHRFDFLATFRGFLGAAASTFSAIRELEVLEERVKSEQQRADALTKSIDSFTQTVREQVAQTLAGSDAKGEVEPIAEALQGHLRDKSNEATAARNEALQAVIKHCQNLEAGQRNAMKRSLDAFFLEQELSVTEKRLFLELGEDGYEAKVECQLPSGVSLQFALAAAEAPKWAGRRRVGDFVAEGITLQAGMKKGFLGEHPERLALSDLVVSSVSLAQTELEVGLRKRADSPEHMVLRLTRSDAGAVEGLIERPGESTLHTDDSDRDKLATFWKHLGEATGPLLKNRTKVISLRLDGDSLYEPGAAKRFVERYVELFAPVVQEIARRSPSDKELSLKIEREDRRREELYLRKDELLALVADIDEKYQGILSPFGLSSVGPSVRPSAPPLPRG